MVLGNREVIESLSRLLLDDSRASGRR